MPAASRNKAGDISIKTEKKFAATLNFRQQMLKSDCRFGRESLDIDFDLLNKEPESKYLFSGRPTILD
jgi:hypothetical protein